MGHFSNGSEGDGYLSRYCFNCKEWRDRKDGKDMGCPIWDVHFLYTYNAEGDAREILDLLIPRSKDGLHNLECSMFNPIGAKGQTKL